MLGLKAARERRGLTQTQLAYHTGSYATAISRWENGHAGCQLGTAVRIAKFLEVSLDYLVFGSEKEGGHE
ncbi:hypothetical protein FACS1894204_13360 [Synergistales bacterium]|nr:hypothetical protein FACS1894204_13360 [Synergistales bacterium]